MPPTIQDVLDRIDVLEAALLAQFDDLETSVLNKIGMLGQSLNNGIFEKDAYKEPSNLLNNEVYGSNLRWRGQSFLLGDEYYLSKVQLFMYRCESPGNTTLEIYEVDENGKPVGEILAAITIPESAIPIGAYGSQDYRWIDFEFATPILLTPNEYGYAIVFHASNLNVTNSLWFAAGNSAPSGVSEYEGGNFLSSNDGGQTWTVWTDRDILFKLFTDSPVKLLLKPKINLSRLG